MESSPDFDFLLRDHFDGDLHLLASVFEALVVSLDRDLTALDQALAERGFLAARKVGHKLAGGLGDFSMSASLHALERLRAELKSESPDAEVARSAAVELRGVIERDVGQIRDWLATRHHA